MSNTLNELQHIKLSMAQLNNDLADTANHSYFTQRCESSILIFVDVENSEDKRWVLQHSNQMFRQITEDMFGYMRGLAYEAEIGKRLIAGNKISAEDYAQFYSDIPVSKSDATGFDIVLSLTLGQQNLPKFLKDEWCGYEIRNHVILDTSEDQITLSLPLNSYANLLAILQRGDLVESMRLTNFSATKEISTKPIITESITLDLF